MEAIGKTTKSENVNAKRRPNVRFNEFTEQVSLMLCQPIYLLLPKTVLVFRTNLAGQKSGSRRLLMKKAKSVCSWWVEHFFRINKLRQVLENKTILSPKQVLDTQQERFS